MTTTTLPVLSLSPSLSFLYIRACMYIDIRMSRVWESIVASARSQALARFACPNARCDFRRYIYVCFRPVCVCVLSLFEVLIYNRMNGTVDVWLLPNCDNFTFLKTRRVFYVKLHL